MRRNYRPQRRRRGCRFCATPDKYVIDYKNIRLLEQFIDNDDASIRKASQTKTCRRHQNQMAQAIKRAREMALLPYTAN